MPLHYDEDYFFNSTPNIISNPKLRDPQISGYAKVYDHFEIKNKNSHAIVVLPTGVGKTGLMGILPYQICRGKVLIITPQLTIKDTVVDSLDPENPQSFWYKRDVFKNREDTPALIEYEKGIPKEVLDAANIIVLNIHKLQARLHASPLNFLDSDYFDMIIIDEAHHSTANTWVTTTDHFETAKVVKLTGTPIRTDGVELAGDLVYKYKLSQAMAKGYVKSLRNVKYIPQQLMFTIDQDESKTYTEKQLLELGLRDEDWIRRSVALSKECNEKVVEESLTLLQEKREGTSVPHMIIAAACSIDHALQVKKLYIEKGYRAEAIHSKLDDDKQSQIKKDINNNRLDIIIHVSMLGEGFDHPYLSIAAIFRPFKSELPYAQFIGRVLRSIPESETSKPEDNIADIVSHENLYLDALWEKYKVEIQESDIIKKLQKENIIIDDDITENSSAEATIIDIGIASEHGKGSVVKDAYLDTELLKQHEEAQRKQAEDIKKLQEVLNIGFEEAKRIYNQTRTKETAYIKRPDLYFTSKRMNLDKEIREVIVPAMIAKYNIDYSGDDLKGCILFNGKFRWITTRVGTNSGMLALYFNTYLKNEIGKPRQQWMTSDFDIAFERLQVAYEYVDGILDNYSQER